MNEMNFDIKRESLYESVARKLEEMILSDKSELSGKLPSEHALAASFDVSLPVIRQALVLLRERGIVVSRNGDGSYTSEPSPEKLTETISRFERAGSFSALDVFVVRTSLERCAARLAADNITEADALSLRALNEEMKSAKGERRAELDVQFHAKIGKISGNMLISMFISSLGTMLVPMLKTASKAKGAPEIGCDEHERMIELLSSHDADGAAELVRAHLAKSMRNFEVGGEL